VAYHAASFGEERQRYEQAVRTELLVVDEVGTEQREAKAAIQDVLDDRIGGKRRTLLISNLSKAALLERLDERTVDRLRELGVIVELAGKSMRSGAL
jgi:DNA replication protein DnaC